MRERLVAAFVGLTVVVLALYGIPRAYVVADLVHSQEQTRVDRTADLLAVALDERVRAGGAVTDAYVGSLAGDGERIAVDLPTGEQAATDDLPDADDGDVWASRGLTGGGTVTVARSASAVGSEVASAVLPLVLLGLLLAGLAALAAYLLAGWLARPFQRQGARLDELLDHERELRVRASHELRTPVTALRLDLEDIALWPETAAPVAAELDRCVGQLDRLNTAIGDLLDRARDHQQAGVIDLDLDALVADTVARLPASTAAGVVHRPSGAAPTRLDPEPVVQVLERLVAACAPGPVELVVVPRPGHYEVRITAAGGGGPRPDQWEAASRAAVDAGGQLGRDGSALVLRLPRNSPIGA